jgi:predicted DNA-binding transcriptional regulator YafY
MRADRLIAVLLLLQARRRMTAADIAVELEVSERTARRDLEALSAAGVPVYAQPGRGGGWELVGGARTDLSGLTADEVRTLFTVAGPSAATSPELRAALRKLVRALPQQFRSNAEAAAESILVDRAGWGRPDRPRPGHLEALERATIDREQVRLGYVAREGSATTRIVHPLGLVRKDAAWYLVADTPDGQRTFRVSRVTEVAPTGEPARRPPGFDLGETWQAVVDRVEELRAPHRIEALADPSVVHVLKWLFGTDVTVGDPGPDGRVAVVVTGKRIEPVAAGFAGFGALVEVLGPPEARKHLARIGRELIALYDP